MARAIVLQPNKADKATSRGDRAGSPTAPTGDRRREAAGIVLLALALFLLLSLLSLAAGDGKLMGPVGAWVATAVYSLFGVGALLCDYVLLVLAIRCLRADPLRVRILGLGGVIGAAVTTAMLLHLLLGNYRLHGMPPGGALGEYGAELLKALLGTVGTALICTAGLALSLIGSTSLSFRGAVMRISDASRGAAGLLRGGVAALFPGEDDEDEAPQKDEKDKDKAERPRRRLREAAPEGVPVLPAEAVAARAPAPAGPPAPAPAAPVAPAPAPVLHEPPRPTRATLPEDEQGAAETQPLVPPPEPVIGTRPDSALRGKARLAKEAKEPRPEKPVKAPKAAPPPAPPPPPVQALEEEDEADEDLAAAVPVPPGAPTLIDMPAREEIEDEAPAAAEEEEEEEEAVEDDLPPVKIDAARPSKPPPPKEDYIKLAGNYELPSISLLDYQEQGQGDLDRQAMLDLAQRLEKTLGDYQVRGRVSEIHPGPVVTMYEFVPAPGTKLSKITALSNDLAMALEALRVRIVAPIPGKAAVGIEVPNKTRETVYLKEILADDCFLKAKSKLTLALGKDIAGMPVCVDLAKMPHLLVAGTTGSGKSVSVNGMVSSLLFNASPEEVKMIMIDPKMLELSIYEGIPHLLLPVVTDPKKANLALKWAVDEMERRYELISRSGVRDIAGYNKKVEKALEERPEQLRLGPRHITVRVEGSDGLEHDVQVAPSEDAVRAAGGVVTEAVRREISDAIAENEALKERLEREEVPRKLPYIVVLIDEFADLMMVASKEVETSVARIAQKARAAGIHLILATQRPSVDVITGLIKANFPSRIAFQVASRIDSRTILDAQGAENLLGMGDMLFTDRGQALRRIHGALVTDNEIHRMVEHLKKQGKPIYDMEILKPRGDEEGEEVEEDMSDEMYDQAVRLVIETRQASISMVQRRLRIGYNRAARMIERMEREGLVSAADGAKGREVLVNSVP